MMLQVLRCLGGSCCDALWTRFQLLFAYAFETSWLWCLLLVSLSVISDMSPCIHEGDGMLTTDMGCRAAPVWHGLRFGRYVTRQIMSSVL